MTARGVVARSLQLFARAPWKLAAIAGLGAAPTLLSEGAAVWALGRAISGPDARGLFVLLAVVAAILPRFSVRPIVDLGLYDCAGHLARGDAGDIAASLRLALARAGIGMRARAAALLSAHALWSIPAVVVASMGRWLLGSTPAAEARELGLAVTASLLLAPLAGWIWLRLSLGTCAAALDPIVETPRRALALSAERMRGRTLEGFGLAAGLFGIASIAWALASLCVKTPAFELFRAEEVQKLLPDLVATEWLWLAIGEALVTIPRAFSGVVWATFYQEARSEE
jgi:hypothetical protein